MLQMPETIDPSIQYELNSLNTLFNLLKKITRQTSKSAKYSHVTPTDTLFYSAYTYNLDILGNLVNELKITFGENGIQCLNDYKSENTLIKFILESLSANHDQLTLKDLASIGMYFEDPLFHSLPLLTHYEKSFKELEVCSSELRSRLEAPTAEFEEAHKAFSLKILDTEESYGRCATDFFFSNHSTLNDILNLRGLLTTLDRNRPRDRYMRKNSALIGNPYTAQVDISAFLSDSDEENQSLDFCSPILYSQMRDLSIYQRPEISSSSDDLHTSVHDPIRKKLG